MTKLRKKQKKADLRQLAFTRFMLIVAVFIIWMGGISVRLVHLQINQHAILRERAVDQRQDVKKTRLLRGTIYDRDERVLAMSLRVKTLYADPNEITDMDAAAKEISKVLGVKSNQILAQLRMGRDEGKRFVPLAKKLDEEAVQKINKTLEQSEIKKADLPQYAGLHWREDQKRSYPHQTLAAHIVGFSNTEDVGQAGIEQSQNDILHGATIKRLQERDRLGRVYDETVEIGEPPKDIVLTISNSIQYKTEQALENGVKAANARSGMAVVLDPKTGEILALANYPTFDPNRYQEFSPESLKNAAIQNVYSPGSVFKLVTYGSALEKKLITPETEIDSGNGTIEVAKHKFTDSHAVGRVTSSKAFAHSSNVCAIKTAMRVGRESFFDYVRKFGFGRATGIGLPGETAGIVRPVDKWNGDSLASMSIGYEIGVSALQMAGAFATIANDGVRVQPHLIKTIREADDTISAPVQPDKIRVVGAETARDLRRMLREVVLTGTGRRAQLNGYSSAGKTGTAWKFDSQTKKINSAKYISSFIGFAPADDPEVVIAVVMDEPRGGARDGGQVSAPVFRAIAEDVLPELGVRPDLRINREILVAEDIPETTEPAKKSAGVKAPIVKEQPERRATKPEVKPAPKTKTTPPNSRPRIVREPEIVALWKSANTEVLKNS